MVSYRFLHLNTVSRTPWKILIVLGEKTTVLLEIILNYREITYMSRLETHFIHFLQREREKKLNEKSRIDIRNENSHTMQHLLWQW